MRWSCSRITIFVGLFLMNVVQAHPVYHFKNSKQQAQFKHLLTELRCLVCQNQDLSDSNAGLAKDLRFKIYNKVREGQSDTQIIDYLTKRYGDFILFKPRLKWSTVFLWFAPFIFVGFGVLLFRRNFNNG